MLMMRCQSGRYISTSEAVWHILFFLFISVFPPVFHVEIHLENGQKVYFYHDFSEMVENPRNTMLMAIFKHCQEENFAKTLLYEDVSSYYTFDKLAYLKCLLWINYFISTNFRIQKSTLDVSIPSCLHLDKMADLFFYTLKGCGL